MVSVACAPTEKLNANKTSKVRKVERTGIRLLEAIARASLDASRKHTAPKLQPQPELPRYEPPGTDGRQTNPAEACLFLIGITAL